MFKGNTMSNAPVEMKFVYMVQQNEHDDFSGMNSIGHKFFPNKESAMKFATDYNRKHNNKKQVPSYYITMDYLGCHATTKEDFEMYKATPEEIGMINEWEWSSDL